MRRSGLRGGAAAGVAEPAWAGVAETGLAVVASAEPVVPFERTDVPAAVERSKVAVELVPGAVSDSGAASVPAGAVAVVGLRTVRRPGMMLRRMLVETKPVRLAPKPGGFPKLGSAVVSGLSKFGTAFVDRGADRRTGRPRTSRCAASSPGSSNAGREVFGGRDAGCANACTASAARIATTPAGTTRTGATPRRTCIILAATQSAAYG
jgi:hypothetical protein